jgi:ubiquinone/menaquinone biosynthesis C-methylase UbiE
MIPYILPNGERFLTWKYRNLLWWEIDGRKTDNPDIRKPYWKTFLDFNKINPLDYYNKNIRIAEVCCGPYGGILKAFFSEGNRYSILNYIDIFADEFREMKYVSFDSYEYLIQTAIENMSCFDNNEIDLLLGYNSLDHGWNIHKALNECFRISKESFISFDCRAAGPSERIIKDINNVFHFQQLNFFDMKSYVENYAEKNNCYVDVSRFPNNNKSFPVINIHLKKLW